MIQLTKDCLFSSGAFRDCYLHPENSSTIIKIERNDNKKFSDANEREKKFYSIIDNNEYFPEYFGEVETNLRNELLFGKVQNFDGTSAIRLDKLCNDRQLINFNKISFFRKRRAKRRNIRRLERLKTKFFSKS